MPAPDIAAAKRAGLPVDLGRLARDGDGWLTPEDRYALKTHGVCVQRQPGTFMIRVRVPGGTLTPAQATVLADLADEHASRWLHLTTRQNVELHHVGPASVPAVLAGVEACGLTTRSTCGHTLRNVMACPDAGVGLDEPFDCRSDARAVSDAIVARSAALNCVLPSRINIAFGGCPSCAEHARINDMGFVAAVDDGVPGYEVWAGGSLGVAPALGLRLASFVGRHHVLAAAEALVEVFVANGDLEAPKRSRLKHVVEAMGERGFRRAFLTAFEQAKARATYAPTPVEMPASDAITAILRHVPDGGWSPSVRPQRRAGFALVTVHVPLGDLTGDDLRAVAALAGEGDGLLHLTRNQDVVLRDVPVGRVGVLRVAAAAIGLDVGRGDSASDVRACTGSDVCALAITASPATGHRLARSPALARNASLRVHVSGCPNSCAQHQASDIGLAGAKVRIRGATELGYTIFAGADLAAGHLGVALGRVADGDAEAAVDGLVGAWECVRQPGERLGDTVRRLGADAFAHHVAALAGSFEPGAEPAVPDPTIP